MERSYSQGSDVPRRCVARGTPLVGNGVELQHSCDDSVELSLIEDLAPVILDDRLAAVLHRDLAGVGEWVGSAQRIGESDLDVTEEDCLGRRARNAHGVHGFFERIAQQGSDHACDGFNQCRLKERELLDRDPEDVDHRPIDNPDESLRTRPEWGLELLKDFVYDEDNVYDDGTIYDPKNGKTYSCKMTLEGNTLKIRGMCKL